MWGPVAWKTHRRADTHGRCGRDMQKKLILIDGRNEEGRSVEERGGFKREGGANEEDQLSVAGLCGACGRLWEPTQRRGSVPGIAMAPMGL